MRYPSTYFGKAQALAERHEPRWGKELHSLVVVSAREVLMERFHPRTALGDFFRENWLEPRDPAVDLETFDPLQDVMPDYLTAESVATESFCRLGLHFLHAGTGYQAFRLEISSGGRLSMSRDIEIVGAKNRFWLRRILGGHIDEFLDLYSDMLDRLVQRAGQLSG